MLNPGRLMNQAPVLLAHKQLTSLQCLMNRERSTSGTDCLNIIFLTVSNAFLKLAPRTTTTDSGPLGKKWNNRICFFYTERNDWDYLLTINMEVRYFKTLRLWWSVLALPLDFLSQWEHSHSRNLVDGTHTTPEVTFRENEFPSVPRAEWGSPH